MRILQVVDNLKLGGTELHVQKVTEALARRGVAVSLLLIGEQGPLSKVYAARGIEIDHIPIGSFTSPRLLGRLKALSKRIRDLAPDVVHAHDRYSNLACALLSRTGIERSVWVASQRWGIPKSVGWRVASRIAFSRADIVTANGEGTAEIARRLSPGAQHVVVTPNFLEGECFVATAGESAAKSAQRQALGLDVPSNAIVLGAVGRLETVKRVDWMLRAVARLREAGHDALLVLVGDGSERQRLEQLAEKLSLSRHVRFVGARPRLPLPHVAFDVTLLSSSSEGVPNALVESFACGVPCVATGVGGVPALVGDCGLVVDRDDEAEFGDAVLLLVSKADQRLQLGRSALAKARSLWHEDVLVPQLLERYRFAIETRQK